ncbi:unnamed protein product [Prunus brigantina]
MPSTRSREPNSCGSAEFDAWWKTRFQGLPASRSCTQGAFQWPGLWAVHAGEETHQFMVQIIKDINARIIEVIGKPSSFVFLRFILLLDSRPRLPSVQVTSVISAGDLELPSVEEEDETLAEPTTVEGTSARRKRKETAPPRDSMVRLEPTFRAPESPPPPTRSKRLRKRTGGGICCYGGYFGGSYRHFGTDDELREAFEEVEKDKVLGGIRKGRRWISRKIKDKIPAEVIAESIALARSNKRRQRRELTSSSWPFLRIRRREQSTTSPGGEEQASNLHPSSCLFIPSQVHLLRPPLLIQAAEFEAMDLDAQLDKLEKLSSPPSKAKSGRWRRLWKDRKSGGLVSRSWMRIEKLLTR